LSFYFKLIKYDFNLLYQIICSAKFGAAKFSPQIKEICFCEEQFLKFAAPQMLE